MPMSLATLTDNLGLPAAPEIFGAGIPHHGIDLSLFNPMGLDLMPQPTGPPPDPHTLFCPAGTRLYPFQEEGVRFFLEHPAALLGDEMGLGKSIQAIAALRLLINQGKVNRAIILCPKTLVFDWYGKLREWAPDLSILALEGKKRRRSWYWTCDVQVNIVGYETWREDLKAKIADPTTFDLVVLDEIQRIKNRCTDTHRSVERLKAPWRWGLSGTPLENSTEDLLSIFAYLKPGLLPFERDYPVAPLRSAIAPFVLRRRKTDVLKELPPKESRTIWLDLTPVQAMAYQAAERAAVASLEQAGHSAAPMLALALLTKLKQICNLDTPTGASCKFDFLSEELDKLREQDCKALVFSQYPDKTLRPLLPRLEPFGTALFDGTLSEWNRRFLVHHFQTGSVPRVLAMSLKCGGVGLTLTRANHVYHFDHWWNPAAAQQAEDRTHRIGQDRTVYVTTLLTRNTVEERIAELLEQKRELFRAVMDPLTDMEVAEELSIQKALTRDELLGLFGVKS